MLKKYFITLFFCCVSCATLAQEKDAIQNIIDQYRKKYAIPAISVSIKLPGDEKIENYVTGYDSLSQKKKITPKSLFQIGSITKTFTATIVFQLIEKNKISINDKLTQWLPQYPRWKNITISDLLHHTSGTYNYIASTDFDKKLRKNPQKYWSLAELADAAYHHIDIDKPGKKYHYTNTDYILLGLIIEKATHKTLQNIFNEYLKKYSLHNTFYKPSNYSDEIKQRMTHGYNRDGTFKFNTDVTDVSMSFSQSAGAMISEPNDLIQWLENLFSGKIITHPSLEIMTEVISEVDAKPIDINVFRIPKIWGKSNSFIEVGAGAGIGLIYFKNNGFTWVHSGGMPGYESFYAYSPCNGIYLALTYNAKPKQQLIFIKMTEEIFKKIHDSPDIVRAIDAYQHNNKLPTYCHINKEKQR